MIVLDTTIVNVAFPSIRADLKFTNTGLAWVVNLLDPGMIVLGGGVGGIPGLAEGLEARIRPHVFADDWRCGIVRPRFGDSSGVRGAAWLWDR